MKKVFSFIAWKWAQYDFWQKMWWFACFWFGGYIGAEKDSTHALVCLYIALGCLGLVFLKWFVWDTIKDSWNEYNQEQERIVDIMKNGADDRRI